MEDKCAWRRTQKIQPHPESSYCYRRGKNNAPTSATFLTLIHTPNQSMLKKSGIYIFSPFSLSRSWPSPNTLICNLLTIPSSTASSFLLIQLRPWNKTRREEGTRRDSVLSLSLCIGTCVLDAFFVRLFRLCPPHPAFQPSVRSPPPSPLIMPYRRTEQTSDRPTECVFSALSRSLPLSHFLTLGFVGGRKMGWFCVWMLMIAYSSKRAWCPLS